MEAISFLSGWTTWLFVLIPAGATAMVTYQAFKKSLTDDQSTINDCNNKIRNTIKGAIIGITLSSLIGIIRSFYL